MRALDHRLPGQGRSQGGGGGEGECLPGVFGDPRVDGPRVQDSGGGNRNPHISHEICAETDKKHVRAVGAPLTIWSREKNRAPLTIRGPPNCQGPYEYEGSCEHQVPTDKQGPL